jgi:hypothetical protein
MRQMRIKMLRHDGLRFIWEINNPLAEEAVAARKHFSFEDSIRTASRQIDHARRGQDCR